MSGYCQIIGGPCALRCRTCRGSKSHLPTDEQIQAELKKHSVQELLDFRSKLRKINSGQAWAIRYWILAELLVRIKSQEWNPSTTALHWLDIQETDDMRRATL